jgi:hypothetical protein
MMMRRMIIGAAAVGMVGMALAMGCSSDGAPSPFPNPDPLLRKSSAELAADAAKRTYESDSQRGGVAPARAQYELMSRRLDIVNLSDNDWADVEVWINKDYVIDVPKMAKNDDKKLDFEMFYDRDGHHFRTENGANPIKNVEIYEDGKMYSVPATME